MYFNIVQRWILSRYFKRDINTDYGIYPENGDEVMMEAVDRNSEYEAAGGEVQAIGRQVSHNENEYDRMYEADDLQNQNENEYDRMFEVDDLQNQENSYDNMYD